MITTLLIIIIISSLFCFGWEYTTVYTPIGIEQGITDINPFGTGAKQKEINWWFRFYIGNFIYKYAPILKPLLKPLFMCIICMSSVYGSLIYWTLMLLSGPITWIIIALWPISVICTAGLNRIIKMITQK